jgi:hypothetical protein
MSSAQPAQPEHLASIRAKICYIESLALERYAADRSTIHRIQHILRETVVRLRPQEFYKAGELYPGEPLLEFSMAGCPDEARCDDYKCIDPCPQMDTLAKLREHYDERLKAAAKSAPNSGQP